MVRRFDATSDDAAFSRFDLITDIASDNDIGLALSPNKVFAMVQGIDSCVCNRNDSGNHHPS
jgi:hypothetical protein